MAGLSRELENLHILWSRSWESRTCIGIFYFGMSQNESKLRWSLQCARTRQQCEIWSGKRNSYTTKNTPQVATCI